MRYYSLRDVPDDKYCVYYMGLKRYFVTYNDMNEFIRTYSSLPRSMRHYYEIVNTNTRKLVIDIDSYMDQCDVVDLLYKLQSIIYNFMSQIISPVVFMSCQKSYHIVIPDILFTTEQCRYITRDINCDNSIYKSIQFIRFEGSTKYNQNRYKKLVIDYSIPFTTANNLSDNFHNYFINGTDKYIKNTNKKPIIIKDIANKLPIPDGFIVRKIVSYNYILLTRTMKINCIICNRVHDNENGYLRFSYGQWKFFCFRNI